MTKKPNVKIFYDFEMTGFRQDTTPISLGLVSSNGKEFYCEFTDWDYSQVDEWTEEHAIRNLTLGSFEKGKCLRLGSYTAIRGNQGEVRQVLLEWLKQFGTVEFWGDCSWYGGVLLNELLGGAFNLPDNVNCLFMDIGTMFRVFGIDPNIDREAFIDDEVTGDKHNALYDSKVIEKCYDKLYRRFVLK